MRRSMKCLSGLLALTLMGFPGPGDHVFAQDHPGGTRMLNPATDIPGKEWCYLAKSTVVIGMPFQPDVTQLTYDGAVYTRHAELDFFFGQNNTPVLARQKTLYKGWIPVVSYDWADKGLRYHIEYFASPLEGQDKTNCVNFVRYSVKNMSDHPIPAVLTAGLCYNSGDYRFAEVRFTPDDMFLATPATGFSDGWSYTMEGGEACREDSLVYSYSGGAALQSVPGVAYKGKFGKSDFSLTPGSKNSLAVYRKTLKPGESYSADFKMPRVPVSMKDSGFMSALRTVHYDDYRSRTIAYWTDLMAGMGDFEIPEERVEHAYRAGIVNALLATREIDGKREQTDGLPYPNFFLTSAPEMNNLYLSAGLNDMPEHYLVPGAILQQQDNGLFFDEAVAHGKIIPAAHGHILYAMAMTAIYTQDKEFARKVFPSMKKGVEFLEKNIDTSSCGLLPSCYAYDAEMITGHYSGQNFFSLMGLRYCVRVARMLGEKEIAESWAKLADRYEQNIKKAIDASAKPDGYIPPGLYAYFTGQEARKGFDEYQTNCDWENMILAYPTEVLSPADPRVPGTLQHVRHEYAEGIMTYRHGMFLHQYITSNMIEQYLAMGDSYTALKDFYHQLLHSGSALECFENLVRPWTDRQVDPVCPPPHAWGGSKQALTVRDLLILEYGGRNGMDEGERELWMYHCLSPAWVIPGKKIAIKKARTEFGTMNSDMTFSQKGAVVHFKPTFHDLPKCYRIRLPYFKTLVGFRSDAKKAEVKDGCIVLSPDATILSIEWKDKPGANKGTVADILMEYRGSDVYKGETNGKAIIETPKPFLLPGEQSGHDQPLSFDLVRRTFQYEYARLAGQQSVGSLLDVKAPGLTTVPEKESAGKK